jgi:D-3-phosphoglycerate dehydrogenase
MMAPKHVGSIDPLEAVVSADPLVYILEPDLYSQEDYRQYFDVLGVSYSTKSFEDQEADTAEAEAASYVVIARGFFPATRYKEFPSLKAIVKWGRGIERIDLDEATCRGVLVVYTPHAVQGVAEAALLLMLALSKKLFSQVEAVRSGRVEDGLGGIELQGRSLGIIGFGSIGRALARMAAGIGMTILVYTTEADLEKTKSYAIKRLSLRELLVNADFVSIHATATPDGKPILDARHLDMMKPGAILINTARGSLVDEGALYGALKAGRLAGAGLDVVIEEPVHPDNPLLKLDNVIITPHSLGFTEEAQRKIKEGVRDSIEMLLHGRVPPYVANPEVVS